MKKYAFKISLSLGKEFLCNKFLKYSQMYNFHQKSNVQLKKNYG